MLSLIRLTPDDVMKHWGVIRLAIERSINPSFLGDVNSTMDKFLDDMRAGMLQVWILNDDHEPVHITITQVITDAYTGEGSMFVFAWYGIKEMTREYMDYSIERLKQYARTNNCKRVEFFTELDSLAEMFVDRFGATKQSFITMGV